jgi:hypothetical protein
MATRSFSLMVNQVLQEAPGCLDSVVLDAVVKSATEFFTRTGVWRYDMDSEQVLEGVYEYDLVGPSSAAEVTMVHSAMHNGQTVIAKSVEWLNANVPNWRTLTGGQIKYRVQTSKSVMRVVPIPDASATGSMDIRVAVAPIRGATTLDAEMYDTYEDEILAGVKARIMRMPRKPWTDKEMASEYDLEFEKAIVDGRIAANKDMTNTVVIVSSVPFN